MAGQATLESRHFDLDEWRSGDTLRVIPVPRGVDFTLNTSIDTLSFGSLGMTAASGKVVVKGRRMTLEGFRADLLGGRATASGFYQTTDVTRPTFDAELRLDSLDIQAAFQKLATVRALAPVARWARGRFSSALHLSGAFGPNMLPRFGSLAGSGSLQTTRLSLEGFPALQRVADALKIPALASPTLAPVRASFDVDEGRMKLRPFTASAGDFAMTVSGSNGVDGSLQYGVQLQAPPTALGEAARRTVSGLLEKAGRSAADLGAAGPVRIGIQLGGTVTDPTVGTDVGRSLTSAGAGAKEAVQGAAEAAGAKALQGAGAAAESARAGAERRTAAATEEARAGRGASCRRRSSAPTRSAPPPAAWRTGCGPRRAPGPTRWWRRPRVPWPKRRPGWPPGSSARRPMRRPTGWCARPTGGRTTSWPRPGPAPTRWRRAWGRRRPTRRRPATPPLRVGLPGGDRATGRQPEAGGRLKFLSLPRPATSNRTTWQTRRWMTCSTTWGRWP